MHHLSQYKYPAPDDPHKRAAGETQPNRRRSGPLSILMFDWPIRRLLAFRGLLAADIARSAPWSSTMGMSMGMRMRMRRSSRCQPFTAFHGRELRFGVAEFLGERNVKITPSPAQRRRGPRTMASSFRLERVPSCRTEIRLTTVGVKKCESPLASNFTDPCQGYPPEDTR
jgi:hypothetical protein